MELKERILEAVIEEFNDKGLKFTMDDIAKRLGISKRTVYTVIDDKDTLFIEMVDYVFCAIKESEKEIAEDSSLDSIEKLKKILIALPQKYKTIDFRKLYDLKSKYPRIYAKIEKRLESDWDATFRIMEQAMEEGRIRRISLPVFQAVVSGTIEYYLSRSLLIDSQITYEEALNQMLDIIINGIIVS
jgi:AcrR family transcriptional regulator